MRRIFELTVLAAIAAVVSGEAQAHTFGVHGAGFAGGFGHPFGGLDHLLAMVTVGLWAAQLGGRAVWLMPLAFMTAMAAGGALGLEQVGLPMVELGIAASLMVLGSLVAFAFRPPLWAGMALVAAFALFHGHAHGAEMPGAASPVLYAAGFLLATGLLHAFGVSAGLAIRRGLAAERWVRAAGAVVAGSGVLLTMV